MNQLKTAKAATTRQSPPEIVSEILAALRGLRCGSIVVTIHDSKVVQIEKNEQVRLQKKAGGETR